MSKILFNMRCQKPEQRDEIKSHLERLRKERPGKKAAEVLLSVLRAAPSNVAQK